MGRSLASLAAREQLRPEVQLERRGEERDLGHRLGDSVVEGHGDGLAGCSRSVCRTRSSTAPGAVQAIALEILPEWRLTRNVAAFNDWLARGAPSDDRVGDRT
jgi:hypothetical protein